MPHAPHGSEKWQSNDDNEKAMAKDIPETSDDDDKASERKADDKDSSPSDDSAAADESGEKSDEEKDEMKKAKPAENDYQGDNTIRHIPDDKGATMLRKDSTNAIKAGTGDDVHKSDDPRASKDYVSIPSMDGWATTDAG